MTEAEKKEHEKKFPIKRGSDRVYGKHVDEFIDYNPENNRLTGSIIEELEMSIRAEQIEQTRLQHLIDFPLKEGYERIYGDHTGRWFTDYPPEDIEQMANDPLAKILQEEIQTVFLCTAEIIARINKSKAE